MVRLCNVILFLIGFSAIGLAQAAPVENSGPDAASLLQQVSEKYRSTKAYHIEGMEEREIRGDLFHQSGKDNHGCRVQLPASVLDLKRMVRWVRW